MTDLQTRIEVEDTDTGERLFIVRTTKGGREQRFFKPHFPIDGNNILSLPRSKGEEEALLQIMGKDAPYLFDVNSQYLHLGFLEAPRTICVHSFNQPQTCLEVRGPNVLVSAGERRYQVMVHGSKKTVVYHAPIVG